jgi:hypothetical protein
VWCSLWGTDWILKYYLDELRLRRVKNIQSAAWNSHKARHFTDVTDESLEQGSGISYANLILECYTIPNLIRCKKNCFPSPSITARRSTEGQGCPCRSSTYSTPTGEIKIFSQAGLKPRSPNAYVETLTFLLRIKNVPDSTLGHEAVVMKRSCLFLTLDRKKNAGTSSRSVHPLISIFFTIHYHNQLLILRCIRYGAERVSLNEPKRYNPDLSACNNSFYELRYPDIQELYKAGISPRLNKLTDQTDHCGNCVFWVYKAVKYMKIFSSSSMALQHKAGLGLLDSRPPSLSCDFTSLFLQFSIW